MLEANVIEDRSPLAMNADEFRALGYQLIDRIAGFIEFLPERPVTRGESPADIRQALGAEQSLPHKGTDPALLASSCGRPAV